MTEIKKYWLPNGVYAFLINAVLFISGFAGFVLLVRFYDKSQFGAWALYLAVTSFADVARAGFVTNALVRYASTQETKSEYSKVLSASLFLHILFTMILMLLIYLIAPIVGRIWSSYEFYKLLMYYPIYAFCQIPFLYFSAIEQANLSFRNQYYSNLLRNTLFIGMIAYIVFSKYNFPVYHLPFLQSLAVIIGGVYLMIANRKTIQISKEIDLKWLKKLIDFGKYVFGSNVVSILFTNIDQILLGYFFNTKVVATYNTAMRIGNFSDIPMTSVASVVYPKSGQRFQIVGNKGLRHLYERSVGSILAFVIPALIVLEIFAEPIVKFIATDAYLDAIPAVYIILLFSLFKPFIKYFGITVESLEKPHFNFNLMITLLLFNLILDLFLIPKYSLVGAAFGSLFSLIIGMIISLAILKKLLDVRVKRIFKYTFSFYIEALEFIIFFNEYKDSFEEKIKKEHSDENI
ncbi:MAG: oligosaccharide flippase family protein [Ignavibacteria bacterium]|jgi:O-antigen/teichoic acid export membrane protein|nr:oligosaccharide flippase family protein [Ignavibacteria bacterium]MDH7526904.1 oligosaccharide flippase family protein [Ignavibacteria bacterium]